MCIYHKYIYDNSDIILFSIFFLLGVARKLASSGFGVFALDYPGFGLSDGLHGYIPSYENLVNDVIEHFSKIKSKI
jgi:acylglycerol lipase